MRSNDVIFSVVQNEWFDDDYKPKIYWAIQCGYSVIDCMAETLICDLGVSFIWKMDRYLLNEWNGKPVG